MSAKYYVGVRLTDTDEQKRRVFRLDREPTRESHGAQYVAVIGPFTTLAAACVMAVYGFSNPHLQHASQAERMAKRDRDMAIKAIQHADIL